VAGVAVDDVVVDESAVDRVVKLVKSWVILDLTISLDHTQLNSVSITRAAAETTSYLAKALARSHGNKPDRQCDGSLNGNVVATQGSDFPFLVRKFSVGKQTL